MLGLVMGLELELGLRLIKESFFFNSEASVELQITIFLLIFKSHIKFG